MSMESLPANHATRVAHTAALLSGELLRHPRFEALYNPDAWGGMVGLMSAVVDCAEQLERVTDYRMALGEGVDWYLTVDAVVAATIAQWAEDYHYLPDDLEPLLVRLED